MKLNSSAAEFEVWLTDVQGIASESLDDAARVLFRREFDRGRAKDAAWHTQAAPSRPVPHRDHRYAVAIQDGDGLGLTFWIKRSLKGEVFLFYPRDPEMNPHASYHLDGRYHQKTYDLKTSLQLRQPLSGSFTATEHLGTFGGHGAGPRIADGTSFDDILVLQPGILTGRSGKIAVDLVAPGTPPAAHHRAMLDVVEERAFEDAVPWIVMAVCR